MSRKKSSLAVLLVGLALALGSCSLGQAPEQSISFATTAGNRQVMESIISQFEAANPGITVDAEFDSSDQYAAALQDGLVAGSAPDVFTLTPGVGTPLSMATLVAEGHLADLTGTEWSDRLPTGLGELTEVDGKRYAVTHDVTGIGVVFNGAAVERAGLKLPNTWSQVLQFCVDARSAGTVAFALGAKTAWNTQLITYALTSTLVYAAEPDFDARMASGQASFSDSAWREALDKYLQMQQAGCFTDDPTNLSYEDASWLVAKGDALSIVLPTSSVASIREDTPEDDRLGMYPLPATEDEFATTMPIGAGTLFAVNADSQQNEAALKFLDFLASDPIQAEYVRDMGTVPAFRPKDFQFEPALVFALPYLDQQRSNPLPDQTWPNTGVQLAHMTGVQQLLAGEATVDEVLAAMDAAYREGVVRPG